MSARASLLTTTMYYSFSKAYTDKLHKSMTFTAAASTPLPEHILQTAFVPRQQHENKNIIGITGLIPLTYLHPPRNPSNELETAWEVHGQG